MARSTKKIQPKVAPDTTAPADGGGPLPAQDTSRTPQVLVWVALAALGMFSLLTFYYPAVRAFYRYRINYNEGWNLYVTRIAMEQHRALYPGNHAVSLGGGYPFLSFYIVGYLSRLTGDYLLTGRLLSLFSLLLSCVLVGLIVKRLTGGWGPPVFAAIFCLGLFCTVGSIYVGMDDPQMLAHPFFLFGLLLYMARPPSTLRIAGLTSLFVLGGNIKHNLLPAPLAVLFDLFLTSASKAVRFIVFGAFFLAVAIAAKILVGGPSFISKMLSPRPYSGEGASGTLFSVYSSLGLPLALSFFWSIVQFRNPRARVISIYFFISLLIGALFAGGFGVNVNTFFDNLFAMSIITGACLDLLWKAPIPSFGKGGKLRFLAPVLLYLTVIVAFIPRARTLPELLRELPFRQRLFDQEVSFLARQPGPAICENLMLCFDAGKPFSVNPFGAGVRAKMGPGSSHDLLSQIAAKQFGVIQTDTPVTQKPARLPDDVLEAIDHNYIEALKAPDAHFYVPRAKQQ